MRILGRYRQIFRCVHDTHMFLLAWSSNLMNFLGNVVSIMRPEGEGPRGVADEVGVVVRNTEIVELLLPTGQP